MRRNTKEILLGLEIGGKNVVQEEDRGIDKNTIRDATDGQHPLCAIWTSFLAFISFYL